jgi:hypothetical protein
MNRLQKLFNATLKDSVRAIQFDLIRTKFRDAGVSLRDEQIEEILSQSSDGNYTLNVEDEQVDAVVLTRDKLGLVHVDVSLDQEVTAILERLLSETETLILDSVDNMAKIIRTQLNRELRPRIVELKKNRVGFNARLWKRWQRPLELFHLFLALCNEAAADFNRFYRSRAAKKNDLVFEVLMRLEARGCQIALEVLTLLESGLADGAQARWRSLHEVTCVAMFIRQHGQELANKYLLHDLVQAYRAANRYQEYSTALGQRSLSKRTLLKLERNYKLVKKKFGASFGKDYGWAATEIGKDNPTFADIEKAVGLEKLRPYYRWASDNVHANVRATQVKLGLPNSPGMLLAGSSDAGLADPGSGAAMSLLQLTNTLLTSRPNVDSLVMCAILGRLEREIGREFLKSHKALTKTPRAQKVDSSRKINKKESV